MTPLLLALALLQQPLERRIASAPDGTVHVTFAARPGICGNGRGSVSMDCDDGNCGHYTVNVGNRDWNEVEYDCDPGPVRVSLRVSGGQVTSLRTYVGGRWRVATGDGVTDLGTVGAREAAAYFLGLGRTCSASRVTRASRGARGVKRSSGWGRPPAKPRRAGSATWWTTAPPTATYANRRCSPCRSDPTRRVSPP